MAIGRFRLFEHPADKARRERREAIAELLHLMRQQRQRVACRIEGVERRIAERKDRECTDGDYIIESRKAAGVEIRTSTQPWYAVRDERYSWE